jgi:putative DNA primase/helicase
MALYGDKIAWVGHWKQWVIWNGRYWEKDDSIHIVTLAKQVVQQMYELIPKFVPPEGSEMTKAELAKGIAGCDNMARINSMIESAKNEAYKSYEEFDTHPLLFNCANGTLHLETGELKMFNPKQMLTKISDVYYDENAECPKWKDTIGKAFKGNIETSHYFQKVCGYAMTGITKEQAFYILWGNGGFGTIFP